MINHGINSIKDFQVQLTESNLYSAGYDGKWGGGSFRGFENLTRFIAGVRGVSAPPIVPVDAANYNAVITQVQTVLSAFGYYTGKIDGWYGDKTSFAFYSMNKDYRKANNLPEWELNWSKRLSNEFLQANKDWADARGLAWQGAHCSIACMGFESAGTFDPAKKNMAGSEAYGLIQFMSPAAKDLGVPLEVIRSMSQMEQLQLVFRYFDMRMRAYGKFAKLDDFYLSIFYPRAIGRGQNETVISGVDTKAYRQNRGLDKNGDGVITVGEISVSIYNSYFEGMLLSNRRIKA